MWMNLVWIAGCTEAPAPLSDTVEIDALLGHLEELQAQADANDATRLYASSGYRGSIDYIEEALIDAGYQPWREPFPVHRYEVIEAALEPGPADGFAVLDFSGPGQATARIVGVDLVLPPGEPNSSTSGCEADDFEAFPPGAVALIQRGSCAFVDKVEHAVAAGAAAVLIFNEGQPGRTEVLQTALPMGQLSAVPVLSLSHEDGAELAATTPEITVVLEATMEATEDENLLAETEGGDPSRLLYLGSHLDSVRAGPGINDNGSGSALNLELAIQIAALGLQPVNRIRFAWWGAEEQGLLGSRAHLIEDDAFTDAIVPIHAALNFDMVASGNGARFVYDGDNSEISDGGGSPGSGAIEAIFGEWFAAQGLQTLPDSMFAASDSLWFVYAGIPTGGLFSGAGGLKSEADAAIFGGQAGQDWDPCYHRGCDRIDGLDPILLEQLARAAGHAVERLAMEPGDLGPGATFRSALGSLPRHRGCHGEEIVDR